MTWGREDCYIEERDALRRRVADLEATVAAVDAVLRMRDEATYHADPPDLPLAQRVAEELKGERQRGRAAAKRECLQVVEAYRHRSVRQPYFYANRVLASVEELLEREVQP